MRRIVVAVVLVLAAGVAVPVGTEAQEGPPGPASGGFEPAPTPPTGSDRPAEAELTRGGFIEFGARLNQRRPNLLHTCRSLSAGRFATCSFESLNPFTGETFGPPAGRGRITQIRVRVGTRGTGPMRVDVVEALRPVTPTGRICCRLVRRSRIFTPAQGRITTINVNLPIFQSRVPNAFGVYVDQRLELTMLNGNTPIPANQSPADVNTQLTGWFPGWSRVGQERTGPAGFSGATVLLRARWRPA